MIATKFDYLAGDPERFDVVICDYPNTDDGMYRVKRVIGLPGETIELKKGELYVNGEFAEQNFEMTPNETDFKNLMDVYLNAVFCPLAMVDRGVFEQEGWHRDEDGTVSGVVYNEMQGALATPDAQLQNALSRAMFPDTAYGFVSGGDPASIPALTYEKYVRVYRRHYSADNCCITLYGKMDMAEKLAFLDEQYLSHMPKSVSRPRLTVQDEQAGVRLHIPYYTEMHEIGRAHV